MIGVHLRRGDFLQLRPDVAWNTKPAILAVDNFLKNNPDVGIFLCTDDGAFVEKRTGKKHYEGINEKFFR